MAQAGKEKPMTADEKEKVVELRLKGLGYQAIKFEADKIWAWHEAGMGFVDPRKYPYLNKALIQYARENNCSFDEAWRIAKVGK